MFGRITTRFILGTSLLYLSGCGSTMPSFSNMSASYQTVVEEYQINNILLNIVRGSQNMPLSFLDIPSVVGTGSITESPSLSATFGSVAPSSIGGFFSAAAAGASVTPGMSLGLSRSFNFTQSSLENAQFQTGFLADVPLQTLTYFGAANFPPELLMHLFIDSVSISDAQGNVTHYVNNPLIENYAQFDTVLKQLQASNLIVQTRLVEQAVGPKMTSSEYAVAMPTALSNNLVVKTISESNGQAKYQLFKVSAVHSLCFSAKKSEGTLIGVYGDKYSCQDSSLDAKANAGRQGIPKFLEPEPKKPSLAIKIRSNRDIYNYLGALLISETRKTNPVTVRLTPSYLAPGTTNVEKMPLIVVNKGSNYGGKALAEVEYRGESYYIPAQANGYSPLVINVLAQLLNLNKIPGSVPPSPAVLIK